MSIFRNTFPSQIIGSLDARQNALVTRTPGQITYLNTRNAWIRMQSSVNIGGSNTTANANILLGGSLYYDPFSTTYSYKQDIGFSSSDNGAYSRVTPSGEDHRLGIRPMPGITSVEVKSKSAYGSLREAIVNFQCWDIKQLEDLEPLYMRPGYTALVEWGWVPALDNNGNINPIVPYFYNIMSAPPSDVSTIAKDLYNQSLAYGGNYDAIFGYVKNYQWSARPDGGYDCQTTIISIGEIIESLKVNYTRPDLVDYKIYDPSSIGSGFLDDEFTNQGSTPSSFLGPAYSKNTLAGMWAELFYKLSDSTATLSPNGVINTIALSPSTTQLLQSAGLISNALYWNTAGTNLVFDSPTANTLGSALVKNNGTANSIFVTLEVALEMINKYITARSSRGKGEPLVRFSLNASDISSDGSSLLCLAHPLQVSVDPSVCLIKSPLWYGTNNPQNVLSSVQSSIPVQQLQAEAQRIYSELLQASSFTLGTGGTDEARFIKAIKDITSDTLFLLIDAELSKAPIGTSKKLDELINFEFDATDLQDVITMTNHLKSVGITATFTPATFSAPNPFSIGAPPIFQAIQAAFFSFQKDLVLSASGNSAASTQAQIVSNLPNALNAINGLDTLPLNFFYNDDPNTELGYIKSIYVNLDFLYRQATDLNLESEDGNEKDQINLYKYVKSIMSAIQKSIGNINNFEIHVDPVDINIARIIDVNYTEPVKPSQLFELQVQNNKSIVRSYNLQSQIFPEQSALVAIGSQAKGGQLGIQNNTMVDFNRNLEDRIIPKKEFPKKDGLHGTGTNYANIAAALANIIQLFAAFNNTTTTTGGVDLNSLYGSSKNSLRDIIVYFQSIVDSPSANRSIIPTKFSFEMDGIGGLVIGNLFRINSDILPKGYKGNNIGVDLAQTITGISHTISDGDWKTRIDALNIILDRKPSKFNTIDISATINNALTALISTPVASLPNQGQGGIITGPFPNSPGTTGTSVTPGQPPPGSTPSPTGKVTYVNAIGKYPLKVTNKRAATDVYQIILHATAGYGRADETISTFLKSGYPAQFVVDRGGTILQVLDVTDNSPHANFANPTSVGIEISNIGRLDYVKNTNPPKWKDGAKRSLTQTERANLNRPHGFGGVAFDRGWKWEGHSACEDYTDIQLQALKEAIKSIIKQCPNILDNGKLNYNFNDTNILQTVWQIPLPNTGPVKGRSYNSKRVVSGKKFRGIYVHASVKGSSHGDPPPTTKIIQMLKDLKKELGA